MALAIINSAATGFWDVAGTWVGGVVPSATDIGQIQPGHTVTIRSATTCLGFNINGGTLIINNNITISDVLCFVAYNIQIVNNATGNVYSTTATTDAPLTIGTASGTPANYARIHIMDIVGPETRTINFDYFTFRGFRPFFGNSTYIEQCNLPNATNTIWISDVTPNARETILLEHPILGRAFGRVYRQGERAGTCTITGYCDWSSHFPALVRNMMASGRRVAIVWDKVVMPYARIEGTPRFTPKRGTQRVDFSITLIEDR